MNENTHMKSALIISVFVFLTGLFAGIFFSTGLSEANVELLGKLLASSISDSSKGALNVLTSSLITNMGPALIMISAVISRFLCPLPLLILLYKSFAVGFCSSLIYISGYEHAFLASLIKVFPHNAVLVPTFIVLAAFTFYASRSALCKSKRSSRKRKDLGKIILIALAAIATGCIAEALCSMIEVL
ncbi:MAG: stage II sporulation protein M [Bacillota bacterium]|nr:stage II sporulation protein M [Bacillota bacterium]